MGFLDRLANVLGLKKKEANVLGTDIIQALSSNIFGYYLSVIFVNLHRITEKGSFCGNKYYFSL
jgi:hypothetical protein